MTDNIAGYLPSELLRFGEMIVLEDNDGTAQGIVYYAEHKTFLDLKLMIVKESARGKGYGRALFESTKEHLKNIGKIVYTVTRNPITMKMAEEVGLKRVSFLQLPVPIILNQIKMAFSFYRAKEVFRKGLFGKPKFTYWITY